MVDKNHKRKMNLKLKKLVICFKKNLISYYPILITPQETSQVVIEYFIIFTILIVLTVIGISTFFPNVQSSFNAVQNAALERIIHADGN